MRSWVSLRRAGEFARTRARGKRYEGRLCAVSALPGPGVLRAGIVTAKSVGGAVVRNRARRRIRAILDRLAGELRGDCVIAVRPAAAEAALADLESDLRTGLARLRTPAKPG